MSKKADLVVASEGYDYSQVENKKLVKKMKETAELVRQKATRVVEDVIEMGKALLEVKAELPHGQFGKWLDAEFGWHARTARLFMSAAERFGTKTEMIADLSATVVYLLSAPSTPDKVVETVIERAEDGKLTVAEVRGIIAKAMKRKRGAKGDVIELFRNQVTRGLQRCHEKADKKALAKVATWLREMAESLESGKKPA